LPSSIRTPRLQVSVGGSLVVGAISAEVQSNNHFSADRFRVEVASSTDPEIVAINPDQRVEVRIGLAGIWQSMIVGKADSVMLDPVKGLISIEGRDLSSILVDSQAGESFANRTSSEIAQLLADRHGLGAVIDSTSTPVGRYYQSEHDRITLGQFSKATTEWDLLAFLATNEGFDIYMIGDALRFGLPIAAVSMALRIEDCISVRLQHCVNLARAVEVTVKSWGSKTAATVVGTARIAGGGPLEKRTITRPNLTADEAQRLAERIAADLKRHEWTAELTMPGELALGSRSRVNIAGTGSVWDRAYSVTQITRHVDLQRGFTQHLTLQGVS